MTKKIYKYQLEIQAHQRIEMPDGAEILSVQVQGSTICIWAIIEEGQPLGERIFRIFGTGHDLPRDIHGFAFVGTVQTGPLVWHVFHGG